VPTLRAARELLAPPEDVWRFLAEPYHFADWWPGVAAVEPDRRGFAAGARWQLRGAEPTLFRRSHGATVLVVREVERPARFAFHVVGDRLDAELVLEPAAGGRTRAQLAVSAPFWVLGFQRALPDRALGRLHALCQTAAGL
jgi:uncharacterized protein YndB with AHSA1/START domain